MTEKTGKKQESGSVSTQFKKGESGNPNGRPKGRKNWSTVYWEALAKLGEANNKTAEDIHMEIIQKGVVEARKGDFKFYKDVVDREYGQAKQEITQRHVIENPERKQEIEKALDDILGDHAEQGDD